jgi:hypothetical protein
MQVAEASADDKRVGRQAATRTRRVAGFPLIVLVAVVGAVAFAARIALFLEGGGLRSFGGYDDGVYYAAADALVHGRMPYRDFLLLHPPGVVLAAAPFAWLGSLTSDATGLAAGRVGFEVVGAANAVLVALLLRRRGLPAAAVGGLTYAIFFPAVYAERSTLLEPLGTLGTLLGLVLLLTRPTSARWTALAGLALGATLGVKIWYVVPTGVVLLIALAMLRGRPRWALLGGSAVGAGVLYLPFFLSAPGTMWRYVVTDQLGRPSADSASPLVRLRSILGVPGYSHGYAGLGWVTPGLVTAVVAVALLLLVALALFGARRARDVEVLLFLALLVTGAAVLFLSPSYFQHYATLTAAPLALLAGTAVGVVSRLAPPPVSTAAAAVVLVAVGALEYHGDRKGVGTPMPGPAVQVAAARVPGCIMADDPTVLAVTNTLSRDLARGCPLWPDVTGWTYESKYLVTRNGHALSRPRNPRWQAAIVHYLTSGNAMIISRSGTGYSRATARALARGRLLARSKGVVLRAVPSARP